MENGETKSDPTTRKGRRFRIVLAGLFHETHTFLDGLTTWEAFDVRERENLLNAKGDASPLGGILDYANRLE